MEGLYSSCLQSSFATGYGVQVKTFLLRSRRLRYLVLFDTAERVFADAATTACVLFDAAGKLI